MQDQAVVYKSKAIIVPHAGIYYSGHAAMAAYQRLELNENIFIIAPSHQESFTNIALPKYTYFDTPLGSLEVNNRLIKDIAERMYNENICLEEYFYLYVQLLLIYLFDVKKKLYSSFVLNSF